MRSYGQFCALARALDIVGERWTLLVVRELLPGPRRFSDLLDGLPGIGPNLLSARLKRLEDEGLILRTVLDPPAASRVYELTERGRSLDDAILALTRFGVDPIAPPAPSDQIQPHWYGLALRAAYRPDGSSTRAESYEIKLDGETFHLIVADGRANAVQGVATDPAVVVDTGVEEFLEIVTGSRRPRKGEVTGDAVAVRRFLRTFRLPAPSAPARS